MKESTQLKIAFLVTLAALVIVSVYALTQNNISSIENMLGILLAFALGMSMTEFVRVWNDEKRIDDIVNDLLAETKQISEKGAIVKPGKLYSATWSLIKSTGMPTRIRPELRKKLTEVFLRLEIYNDDVQRYEEYSIQPKCDKDVESGFKETMEQSKKQLLTLCEETIELAKTLGYDLK